MNTVSVKEKDQVIYFETLSARSMPLPATEDPLFQKAGVVSSLTEKAIAETRESLQRALRIVGDVSSVLSESLASAKLRPKEVEVVFGVKVEGEGGNTLITKIGAGAHFEITMKWDFSSEPGAPDK